MKAKEKKTSAERLRRRFVSLSAWVIAWCAAGVALAVLAGLMSVDVIPVTDAVRWVFIVVTVMAVMLAFTGGFLLYRETLREARLVKEEQRILQAHSDEESIPAKPASDLSGNREYDLEK